MGSSQSSPEPQPVEVPPPVVSAAKPTHRREVEEVEVVIRAKVRREEDKTVAVAKIVGE